jgi:hypothetical protein
MRHADLADPDLMEADLEECAVLDVDGIVFLLWDTLDNLDIQFTSTDDGCSINNITSF